MCVYVIHKNIDACLGGRGRLGRGGPGSRLHWVPTSRARPGPPDLLASPALRPASPARAPPPSPAGPHAPVLRCLYFLPCHLSKSVIASKSSPHGPELELHPRPATPTCQPPALPSSTPALRGSGVARGAELRGGAGGGARCGPGVHLRSSGRGTGLRSRAVATCA